MSTADGEVPLVNREEGLDVSLPRPAESSVIWNSGAQEGKAPVEQTAQNSEEEKVREALEFSEPEKLQKKR